MADENALPTRAVLTTAEVAEFLRISAPTVRKLGCAGEIEILKGLRVHRYTAESVRSYLRRKKQ